MTDDTIETAADKPLKNLAADERAVNPPVVVTDESAPVMSLEPGSLPHGYVPPQPEPTAKEKLRAFEDANFGANVVRVNDQIERGRGSPFADMDDDKRKHYQALENLIEAESKLADTSAALASAEAAHQAALATVAARENDASG